MTMIFVLFSSIVYAEDGTSDQPTGEQPEDTQEQKTCTVMRSNGKDVMIVKSKTIGDAAIKAVAKKLIPKKYKFKKYSVKGTLEYVEEKQGSLKAGLKSANSKESAENALYKIVKSKSSPITIKVIATKNISRKTQVRVKFKYTNDLYPFEFKVQSKGTKGTVKKKFRLTTINGRFDSKKKIATKEKKGKYTIILTGHKNNPKNITYKKYKQYKKNVEKLAIKNYGDVFLGRNLVNYGLKFVGNPYKVGGMSLTNGIDCVGFVRALYKKFGITLPGNRNKLFRTGKIVPYSKARAGDIVFYGVHPAIYIGNGKIVSARKSGIRVSRINYKKWTYIRRIR